MNDQAWAEAIYDAVIGASTRQQSLGTVKNLVGKVREECAGVLGAEVLRLMGERDREDAQSVARCAMLIRDDAKEKAQ